MVIEAGVVAGYVIAWAISKARRIGGKLDDEFDAATGLVLDRLHDAVTKRLSGDSVLEDLDEEAGQVAGGEGGVSELTRQRVELAVTAAARKDEAFAQVIARLLGDLREAEQAAGRSVATGHVRVFTGDARAEASQGGIAVGQVGGGMHVTSSGGLPSDPPEPGRPGR